MKLQLKRKDFYTVKEGQTVREIARELFLPLSLLVSVNHLKSEVKKGQILYVPKNGYTMYRVEGGESKEGLCGSAEEFERKNGTKYLYPTQEVAL